MSPQKITIRKSAQMIIQFLAENKGSMSSLLILTHDYPDPDSLASAFALHYLAEHAYGISSRIVYGGIIGRMENRAMVRILKLPVHKLKPSDFKKYSAAALMDTQPAFANNSFPKNRKAALVIDQHPSVAKPNADLAIINTECGATSVIMAQCILSLSLEIPVRLATALTYGILSDTLNLYRCHDPEVVKIYLSILSRSDLGDLAKIQNPVRSRKFFATLGLAIQNAMVRRGLIAVHLGFVETPDLVSQVADFLLTYQEANWSFCTGRYKGKLHVSLRSAKTGVGAGEILRDIFENRGQAGGHDVIAGGSFKVGETTEGSVWQGAEEALAVKLIKRLRMPLRGEFYYPFRKPPASPTQEALL